MKLSTPVKIAIGVATAAVFLGFLLVLLPIPVVILATRGAIPLSEEQVRAAVEAFLGGFNVIAALTGAVNVLNLALIAFYIAHAIMNTHGLTALRIALAVGLFTFPFLAMPACFLIYIAPSSPPAWALGPPGEPKPEEMNRPTPASARLLTIIAVIVIICVLLVPLSLLVIVGLSLLAPSIGNLFSADIGRWSVAPAQYSVDQLLLPIFSLIAASTEPPNNSLQLTRLAAENARGPCPPGCAIMDQPLPDPPGS